MARYFSSPHRELARRRHRAHSASRFVGFSDEEGTPDSCSTWTLLIKYSECWAEKRLPLKMQMFKSHALGHSTLPLCCCCCSVAKLCPTLCNPMDCSTPGFPVPHYVLEFFKFMSTELVMLPNYLIFCHLLLLSSIFPSIRVLGKTEGKTCI